MSRMPSSNWRLPGSEQIRALSVHSEYRMPGRPQASLRYLPLTLTVLFSYLHHMSKVPAVTPDSTKIRQLIWDTGYSVTDFARTLRPRRSVQTVKNLAWNRQRVSVTFLRQIAAALGVEVSEITLPDEAAAH